WWPHQIFGNRYAERAGTLEVHPWADDRPMKDRQRKGAILRDNWRERFEQFLKSLGETSAYVTIDLDCLRAQEAVTNWENGRFSIADLEWALGKLRESSHILGGDICGAYSKPEYARFKQRFAAEFDHPKIELPSSDQTRAINLQLCGATGSRAGGSAGSYARFFCSSVGAPGSADCAQREGAIAFLSALGAEALSGRRTSPRDGDQTWKRRAAHFLGRNACRGTEQYGASRPADCRADLRAALGFDVAGSRAEPIRG